ncbi:MAG: HEAT repeat domain-containing protein, partial [Polyangiaceae bacterium]|nr:HEAT repeat domain-containing protein [Polyangiaceae bacterium]
HEPYRAQTFGERDIDRYDSEIHRVDGAVGRLVREVRARLSREVVFVITADHGEEFRDHGGIHHGSTVYDEQVRVPLLVLAPGIPPRRVMAPVELVDLAPTILRFVDVEIPSTMRGDDLGNVLIGNGPAPRTAVSAVTSKRALIDWPYKLIYDTRYRLIELFDLSTDPRERTNLAAREPLRVRALQTELGAFLDRLSRQARATVDPTTLAMRRARLGDPRATEPLIAIADDGTKDIGTRHEAVRLLGSLQDDAARAVLARLLGERDSRLANEAAIALAHLGDARGRAHLVALAADADVARRHRAAVALGVLGDRRAVPALIESVDKGEDVRDRRLAAQILGELRDPRAVDSLTAAMGEFRLRASAAIALGKIGDHRAYDAIASALGSEQHVNNRDAMVRALGELGDPRALPLLVSIASNEPEMVSATRAIIRLRGLERGVVGGMSLWGRSRETPRAVVCPDAPRPGCTEGPREVALSLRVTPTLRGRDAQAVLLARVGRGESVSLQWEVAGHALPPIVLEAEASEHRVTVPAEALTGARAPARLFVSSDVQLVIDHLLLLPPRSSGGV